MPDLKIRPFSKELAHHFKTINEEWIQDMFVLEDIDREMLANPQTHIMDKGGAILFVEASGLGVVGTGALLRSAPGEYELVKMGVLKNARGLKAGEFLLQELIKTAQWLGARKLYLLTNKKCEAAIHLYEKNGFQHSKEIMDRYGCEYKRCDVAMVWLGGTQWTTT